ncbi:AraC family transcriptional regulator [Planotetraspora thailandica]|uniref:AraC family transcriptional regulator n=1 Tax=Planotetraspora thailandica TaxID=487172 RepID=A0A8J3V5H9_9ACTN|nr:DJ-1/PfpI family protein [Planotetraspora thailandica]GII57748.1 AraC family transcriptional regulator [Planotetraspora thailandica]
MQSRGGGTRRVAILAFDGVTMIDVAGPADVFSHAARLGAAYEVTVVSPDGADVVTSTGLTLHVARAAAECGPVHTVLVPGAYGMVDRPFDAALVHAVGHLVQGAERVASVCTGSFLLAELGLLDGRRATTHWRQTDVFARRYRRVLVQPDAIYVRDGHILTSAGVSSGVDLSLAMVENDHGPTLAADVAEAMVVFMQRPGALSQFSAPSRRHVGRDDPLRPLLDAIAADPAGDYTVPSMAAVAAVSTRQLTRLFHDAVGTTPARYVETVRLENAQSLLQRGHTVGAAAAKSGFGSAETLRRVFTSRFGVSPSAYRDRPHPVPPSHAASPE